MADDVQAAATPEAKPKPKRRMSTRTAAIVVFGILLGIPLVYIFVVPRAAKDHMASTKTKSQIKQYELICESYYQDWGSYPEQAEADPITAEFLARLRTVDGGQSLYRVEDFDFDGKGRPVDGFGNLFYYQQPGTVHPDGFDLWSAGSDGVFGVDGSADPAAAQAVDAHDDGTCDDIANWKRLY